MVVLSMVASKGAHVRRQIGYQPFVRGTQANQQLIV
jgi:hypothetical protein